MVQPLIIEAVFVGRDGSLGYRYLKRYKLVVNMNSVRDVNGVGHECPYSTVEAFLRNWHEVRVVNQVGEEEKKRRRIHNLAFFPGRVEPS